jgi:hypothetical protein
MATTVDLGSQGDPGMPPPDIKSANSLRAIDLVGGKGKQINS